MKKFFLIIVVVVSALAGCKIDESGLPQKGNVDPMLLGTWYLKTAINFEPGYSPDVVTDFTAKDYFIFNNDNTVKVSSSQPDTSATGNYSYTNNASVQQITIGKRNEGFTTYTISKLTTDSLIMSWTLSVTAGSGTTSIPIIYKLAHK